MKIKYLLRLPILTFLIFNSCAIYDSDFDCPPDIGVPCTSSSEIESMVVETEDGPDIFLGKEIVIPCTNLSSSDCGCIKNESKKEKRVWICTHSTNCGHQVQGHYIYQKELSEGNTSCSLQPPMCNSDYQFNDAISE